MTDGSCREFYATVRDIFFSVSYWAKLWRGRHCQIAHSSGNLLQRWTVPFISIRTILETQRMAW